MSKKTRTILFSFTLLAISLILLLAFFFTQQPSNIQPLNIFASEKHIQKGESIYNFYTVSHKDAVLSFEVNKEGIIEINTNFIKGKKAGVVEVTITATLNDQETQTSFKIYVYENEFSCDIIPQSNCSFSGSVLSMTANICQFKVTLYDNLGQVILDSTCSYSATNDATIIYEFNTFLLSAQENCEVTINYYNLNIKITFSVIIQ